MTFHIGIDIGGTGIAGAVVDNSGKTSHRQELPTPWQEGGPAILKQAAQVVRKIMSSASGNLEAIGIGTGGQIDSDNGIVYSATAVLPGYTGLKIKETLEDR